MVEHHDTNFFQTEKQLRKAIARFGEPFLQDLRILQTADIADHIVPKDITPEKLERWRTAPEKIDEMFEHIHSKQNCFSLKDMAVKGSDLVELGLSGSEIGKTLKEMLNLVVEEALPNEKGALLSYFALDREKMAEEMPIEKEEQDEVER